MNEREKCYTPEEVAAILRVDKETVMRRLRKGEMPGFKVGKFWRITESQLKEYQNQR